MNIAVDLGRKATKQTKIQNISDRIFILWPGSCPRGGTLGRRGCPGGQKKISSNIFYIYFNL